MSASAIAPISPVTAIGSANMPNSAEAAHAAAHVSQTQDPAMQAFNMAQQQQLFSQLMQSTNSTLMSDCMKPPKDDDSDD